MAETSNELNEVGMSKYGQESSTTSLERQTATRAPAKQMFLASLAAVSATALGQSGTNLLDVSLDNQEDNEFGALYTDWPQADNNPSVMAVTDGNLDLETATTLLTERLQSTET